MNATIFELSTIAKTAGRVTITNIPCMIDRDGTTHYPDGVFANLLDIALRSAAHTATGNITVSYEEESQWLDAITPSPSLLFH